MYYLQSKGHKYNNVVKQLGINMYREMQLELYNKDGLIKEEYKVESATRAYFAEFYGLRYIYYGDNMKKMIAGIIALAAEIHLLNALCLMVFTPSGIFTVLALDCHILCRNYCDYIVRI